MADMLGGENHRVVTAASGSKAIDLLKDDTFDLVLTNLEMPGIDGFEVLRQTREIAPQAVVLILVTPASLGSAIDALREGAYDYLVKPCSAEELRLKIEKGLERVRLTEEHKRAEEALRQRTAQLEGLRQVGLEITAELNLEALLHSIASRAVELVGGTAGGLYLYRPDRDVLEWSVLVGSNLAPVGTVLRRGEGLAGKVWETGEPLIVDDYQHWEGRAAAWEGYPVGAAVGAPVRWGEEFLGVLNVHTDALRAFSPADAELLNFFATQAAIAIRNARLYEETRRRAERLAVVNRIARAVGKTLHLDDLMETVYREVTSIFQADAFYIALYDEEANELDFRLRVDEGIREPRERQPLGAGLTSLVVSEGKPILIRDFEKEKERLPEVRLWGTMKAPPSWLGVPMKIGERVVGVISVQAYRPYAYGEEEQQLLCTIADQVAMAVENARLYEETQRRALEQETVSRIACALNTPDIRDAFPALVKGLQDLTGCEMVILMAMDEAGEHFIMTVLESPFPIPDEGDVIPLSATAAAGDLKAGRSHLTADLSTEKGFPFEQALYQAGLRSLVTLPLLVGGELFGALSLGSSEMDVFREDQLPVLQQIADAVAISLENSLLLQAERGQRELAEALGEATAALTAALDFEQVLDCILEQVSRIVPNDATNVMLIEGDQARIVRWRGYERFGMEEFVSTLVFRIPEVASLRQMIESREPIVIPDTATYPGWVRVPATEWLRSYAAAPIIVRGEVIGFLNVDSATPNFFTQAHAEALRAFADHAAAAIENARLYEAEQRRARERGLLLEIADAITSTLDMREVLKLVTQRAAQACGADRCTILLLDEEGKNLIPVMSQFASGTRDKKMWRLFKHTLYPRPLAEVPEAQQVFREGRPLFIPDALASSLPRYWIEPFNVKSLLVVPLISKGRPIGLMGLDHMEEGKGFTAEQVNLAMTIGAQAATAIENAKLYQQIQGQLNELQALQETTSDLQSSLALQEVLSRIVRAVVRLGYTAAMLAQYEEETNRLTVRAYSIDPAIVEAGEALAGRKVMGAYVTLDQTENLGVHATLTGEIRITHSLHDLLRPVVSAEVCQIAQEMAGIKTMATLPLMAKGRLVGNMVVGTEREEITESELDSLKALAAQAAIAIENARLFEEVRQRVAELEALRRSSLQLTSSLDLPAVLDSIAESALSLVGATDCHIYLYDEESETFTFGTALWEDGRRESAVKAPRRHGLTATVAREGRIMVINDAAHHPLYTTPEAQEWGLQAIAGFPLKRAGRVLGVFTIAFLEPHTFGEEELRVLGLLADQAAIAIENARLYEKIERSLEQLTALRQTSLDITARLDTTALLEAIVQRATELLKAKGGGIYLFDSARQELTVVVDHGLERSTVGTTLKLGEGMAGRVAQTGEPLIVSDYRTWPGRSEKYAEDQFTAVVEVPLKWQDQVTGVLAIVDDVEERVFTEDDAQLLSLFADQAAIAIENARLFEETRRRLIREERLNQLAHALGGEMELAPIISRLLPLAVELTGADAGAVAILDPDRQVITYPYQYNLPDSLAEIEVPAGDGVAGFTMTFGQTVLLEDYREHPAALQAWVEAGIRSVLGVPLLAGDQVVGALGLFSLEEVRPFAPEAVAAAKAAGRLAAVAIQRARLYEETRERMAELGTLYKVVTAGMTSVRLDEILDQTMAALQETLQPDSIGILLVEPETNELVIRAYTGFPIGPKLMRRPLGVGIPGWVVQTGEPVLLADVRGDERYYACDPDTRSELCVPLRVGERIIGALNLESHRIGAFSEDDLRLLSTLAGHLAAVIENARLFEETERLKAFNESIVQGVTEAILMEDAQGVLTFANPAAEELLGYTREELIGKHWTAIVPKDEREKVRQEAAKRPSGIAGRYETALLSKEGRVIPVLVSARPLFEEGKFVGVLSAFTDITEHKQVEERLAYMATHDPLTDVPNRRGFFTLAEQQLKVADRTKRKMLMLFADFDNLKQINDAFGHTEGDRALIEVADVLKETFRESDIIARIGGDEFVVLALEADEENAEVLVTRLRQNLEARNAEEGRRYKLSLSVGIARYDPEDPCSIDELLTRADRSMYERKQLLQSSNPSLRC